MRAVIGFGANLGDRVRTIEVALARLAALPGYRISRISHLYETAPVGGPPQPAYVNGAVLVEAGPRSAAAIVADLLAIERALGRVRDQRDGPRTIDLDLLWTDGPPSDDPIALVPHPRLETRAFALAPLVDVAPDACDRRGVRYAEHLARVDRGPEVLVRMSVALSIDHVSDTGAGDGGGSATPGPSPDRDHDEPS
jgi:2-amino-4-hydroxy-6-hydroxymethyldihydropteridine diphosphokinase